LTPKNQELSKKYVAPITAAPPRTPRDTEVFEVLLGQVGENRNIDAVLNKAVGVLGHAELFEPHLSHPPIILTMLG
jgi:hypothetical protein